MNTNTNTVNNLSPFEQAFLVNRQIRECSYDPSINFEVQEGADGKKVIILGLPYKLLWFHTYCSQNNLKGRIESDDFSVQFFDNHGTGMVTAKAKVIINDVVIATASASKGFFLNNNLMMDAVVQNATGSAASRALSYAGFGCISASDLENLDLQNPSQSNPNVSAQELPTHFAAPVQNTGAVPPAVTSQSSPGQFGPAAVPNAPVTGNTVPEQTGIPGFHPNVPANGGNVVDPITAAKMVKWTWNGPNNGKTMGELLAMKPKDVIWAAEKARANNPESKAAVDAAKALYIEACQKCGVAPKSLNA